MRIPVIDSHTGGEPTRVVLSGLTLDAPTMAERRDEFRGRYDHLRSGIIHEPRGSDVLVGALLTPPVNEGSTTGVIFFNNASYLGMCGHGTIGVVETLRWLGRIEPGVHRIDSPVGTVSVALSPDGEVTLTNVVSYCLQENVRVEVPGFGTVIGDVAYGGNWFFVVQEPQFAIDLPQTKRLTDLTERIKQALADAEIHGKDGAIIDHIELAGPSQVADSRNFVLCPGGAYDRSPCGTGTSAKLACLVHHGHLAPGQPYRQESVTGSIFTGFATITEGGIIPQITGRASVTAQGDLIFNEDDPLRWGLAT
jgi:4-hydroxyproline epimerase